METRSVVGKVFLPDINQDLGTDEEYPCGQVAPLGLVVFGGITLHLGGW